MESCLAAVIQLYIDHENILSYLIERVFILVLLSLQNAINNGEHPKDAVKLKSDTSLEDWLAVHVVDFMNRIDLLYGLVKDACTFESCPKMTGGQKYEYKWADDGEYRVNNIVM